MGSVPFTELLLKDYVKSYVLWKIGTDLEGHLYKELASGIVEYYLFWHKF